jgi:hypothetical protein
MPDRRNLGRKNRAIRTSAITATTSQAITERPSLKAAPFNPTICSVERLVSSREPAMIGKVRERPPRKKPSDVDFSSRRVIRNVRYAAKKVNARNEISVIITIGENYS